LRKTREFSVKFDAVVSVQVKARDFDEAKEKAYGLVNEAEKKISKALEDSAPAFEVMDWYMVVDEETGQELLR